MKCKVNVKLKPEVLDPQGKTILHMLKKMGYQEISNVRVGKSIELSFDADSSSEKAKSQIEEISQKILSNPVIEDFEYEFTE